MGGSEERGRGGVLFYVAGLVIYWFNGSFVHWAVVCEMRLQGTDTQHTPLTSNPFNIHNSAIKSPGENH